MTVVLCSSHLRSLTITYKASFKKIGTVLDVQVSVFIRQYRINVFSALRME